MAKNYEEKLMEQGIDAYGLIEKKFEWKYVLNWLIDWKYRQIVNLPKWLAQQVTSENDLDILVQLEGWKTTKIPDHEKAIQILRWIKGNIRYIGDIQSWQNEEKWQDALITYKKGTGDCEDGAILFFILCRKAGIPSNRVRIVAGDVVGGGHCWAEFLIAPFSYCMDWCYWPDMTDFSNKKPYIIGQGNYKKIWFMCNDVKGFGGYIK